jgi:hypothetical protein
MKNPWSYNSYRASLMFEGKRFALVTPDGMDALSPSDATRLVSLLNSGERTLRLIQENAAALKFADEMLSKEERN